MRRLKIKLILFLHIWQILFTANSFCNLQYFFNGFSIYILRPLFITAKVVNIIEYCLITHHITQINMSLLRTLYWLYEEEGDRNRKICN